MSKKLERYWYQQGVKAGSTDGWMSLEETLEEDIERWPGVRDYQELVQRGIDEWEGTDHFNLIYRTKMMGDAYDSVKLPVGTLVTNEAFEKYQEYRDEFWEGYLAGRQKIGIDVYKLAKKLLAGKKRGKMSATKNRPRKRLQGKQLSLKGLRR